MAEHEGASVGGLEPGGPFVRVLVDDGRDFVLCGADEDAIEAWRGRAVAEGRPFVALRVADDQAAVEYDLAHLDRRLAPWAVELLDRYDGFHGCAYGVIRRLTPDDAREVAGKVTELVSSSESTVSTAVAAALRSDDYDG